MEIDDLLYQDIEEVHALTSLVFEESHDLKEIKDLYMKLHDDKEHYRFLVAKQDNKVVGFLSMSMAYNLLDGNKKFVTLWWVCAHPDYRRQGIATALLQRAEYLAKKHDCELICFLSENERKGAHEFYIKNGYNMGFKGFMKEL